MKSLIVTLAAVLVLCSSLAMASDDVLTLATTTANWTLPSASGSTAIYYRSDEGTGGKRYVQVFIIDPDQQVSLKDSILYMSQPFMTDETDQELRAGLSVLKLLEKHNAKRVTMKDKEQSKKFGRDIYLEPVKLRDIRLVVATIAKF